MGLLKAARGAVVEDLTIDWGSDEADPTSLDAFELVPPELAPSQTVEPPASSATASILANNLTPPMFHLKRIQQAPLSDELPTALYPGFRFSVFAIIHRPLDLRAISSAIRTVKLRGRVYGTDIPVECDVPVSPLQLPLLETSQTHEPAPRLLLHVLSARALIQSIENRPGANSEESISQIVDLGTRYSLASSQTSFVAIDEGSIVGGERDRGTRTEGQSTNPQPIDTSTVEAAYLTPINTSTLESAYLAPSTSGVDSLRTVPSMSSRLMALEMISDEDELRYESYSLEEETLEYDQNRMAVELDDDEEMQLRELLAALAMDDTPLNYRAGPPLADRLLSTGRAPPGPAQAIMQIDALEGLEEVTPSLAEELARFEYEDARIVPHTLRASSRHGRPKVPLPLDLSRAQAPSDDIIANIARHQDFDGSFKRSVLSALGFPTPKRKSWNPLRFFTNDDDSAPPTPELLIDSVDDDTIREKVWMTCLVLEFWEKKCKEDMDVWDMLAGRAMDFLRNAVQKSAGVIDGEEFLRECRELAGTFIH